MNISSLSDTAAAYLAGLIDGEGTITLCRKDKNENRQLAVTISNTELKILEYAKQNIGAGKITRKRTSSSNHTPSYTYAIYNRQALLVLKQIYPYLQSYKATRAKLIIENYIRLTPRNGKYSQTLKSSREQFETSLLSIKP